MEAQKKIKEQYEVLNIRIDNFDKTKKLYELEKELHNKFEECVKEWLDVTGLTEKEFWTKGIPSEMFTFLDGWDHKAGRAVCEFFLESLKE